MTSAVFRATYSDWKVVKGRKVVQVVLELPLETADEAYRVLGGMPIAASEVWCAVARLNVVPAPSRKGDSSSGEREAASDPVFLAEREHKPKSPAQIAGYLCTLGSFQTFLRERFTDQWVPNAKTGRTKEEVAKETLYDICAVTSRTQLTDANTEWHALQLAFRLWENHPELEEA